MPQDFVNKRIRGMYLMFKVSMRNSICDENSGCKIRVTS